MKILVTGGAGFIGSNLASGFEKTVAWYLENEDWWSRVLSGDYQLERLGLSR